ncbi:unnamed protein product [Sphagnum troendelagicum]|uniref:Retrotransposon gag domain-containing protein n=1 Tax=Sphagnum troendelagicum TaxID=128251 RepID=A0ABP0U9P2_9BRYO
MTSPQGLDDLFWGRDCEDVTDWAERLTMAAEVRDLTPDKLFKVAKLNLRGRAKEWFRRLQPAPVDWAELRTLMIQKYGNINADDIRMKLDAIKQEPREWVQKYFERLDKLFQKDIEELVGAAIEVEGVLAELGETPYEPLREEQEEEAEETAMEKQIDILNNTLINFFKRNALNPEPSSYSTMFEGCQICRARGHIATSCPRLNEARRKYAECNMPHRTEGGEIKSTYCAGLEHSEDDYWKRPRFGAANFLETLPDDEGTLQQSNKLCRSEKIFSYTGAPRRRMSVEVATGGAVPSPEVANGVTIHPGLGVDEKVSSTTVQDLFAYGVSIDTDKKTEILEAVVGYGVTPSPMKHQQTRTTRMAVSDAILVGEAGRNARNTGGVFGSVVNGMNEQLNKVEDREVKYLTEEGPGILKEEVRANPQQGIPTGFLSENVLCSADLIHTSINLVNFTEEDTNSDALPAHEQEAVESLSHTSLERKSVTLDCGVGKDLVKADSLLMVPSLDSACQSAQRSGSMHTSNQELAAAAMMKEALVYPSESHSDVPGGMEEDLHAMGTHSESAACSPDVSQVIMPSEHDQETCENKKSTCQSELQTDSHGSQHDMPSEEMMVPPNVAKEVDIQSQTSAMAQQSDLDVEEPASVANANQEQGSSSKMTSMVSARSSSLDTSHAIYHVSPMPCPKQEPEATSENIRSGTSDLDILSVHDAGDKSSVSLNTISSTTGILPSMDSSHLDPKGCTIPPYSDHGSIQPHIEEKFPREITTSFPIERVTEEELNEAAVSKVETYEDSVDGMMDLSGSLEPLYCQMYVNCISPNFHEAPEEEAKRQVDVMTDLSKMKRSNSEYACHVTLPTKRDVNGRFCEDYRLLSCNRIYMIQDAEGRQWERSCRDFQIYHVQPD